MKALLTVLALSATPATAENYEAERDRAYADAMVIASIKGETSPCAIIGTQTANVMVRRLNGLAMSEQMSEPNLAFIHFVIRDAYSQPFFQSLEMKKQLVRDFRERYELECYQILGSSG